MLDYTAERPDWPEHLALFREARPPHAPAVMAAARERLILANTPLANDTVTRFLRRFPACRADRGDLAGEAYLQLVRCVDGFDPDAGVRFSTYCAGSVWFQLADLRNVERGAVGVNRSMIQDVYRFRRAARRLEAAGLPAGDDEAIAATGFAPVRAELLRSKLALARARREYEGVAGFLESVPGRGHGDASRAAEAADRLAGLMRCLPAKDRDLLAAVYGLGGRDPASARAVGAGLGVSCQRVNERVRGALSRLCREAGVPGDGAAVRRRWAS